MPSSPQPPSIRHGPSAACPASWRKRPKPFSDHLVSTTARFLGPVKLILLLTDSPLLKLLLDDTRTSGAGELDEGEAFIPSEIEQLNVISHQVPPKSSESFPRYRSIQIALRPPCTFPLWATFIAVMALEGRLNSVEVLCESLAWSTPSTTASGVDWWYLRPFTDIPALASETHNHTICAKQQKHTYAYSAAARTLKSQSARYNAPSSFLDLLSYLSTRTRT
ncbi:hypothetical protein BDN70DRAFT_900711 [Pholiota conissans]|uniref:Uncharacterized protein n=1 Tax=Pholiota conissans TaxID=109636 RepID=A0A9P5YQQ6_9AGAR|nr:hypothetical protein BDN70DRAFT_900711 [Pholiota conissans]